MARARNIKPGFFTHEQMAENDPLGRLLFIGLTTIADYKGELEWRPKRIKIQILPYDECDIQSLAINLDKSGFVRFYSDGEKIFLKIVNFDKHQNPHKNEREAGSEIPAYTEDMRQVIDIKTLTINPDLSGADQEQDGTAPADSLIPHPDSLILIPDPSDSAEPHSDSTPEDDEPVLIRMPLNDKTEFPITEPMIAKWQELYPAIDVMQHLRNMVGWCDAKPANRKTAKGVKVFITGWLSREQNKAPTGAGNHAANQPIPFRSAAGTGKQPITNLDDTSWGDNLYAALDIG